ncbi:MAG: hypothetical protein LH477_12870 [Nocardioides sp.]|nr:hypothetical protein [Nocardioides sp.]
MSLASRVVSIAATAALAASTLAFAPAATAAPGDATLTYAPTAILNEGSCVDHAFTYSVELPEGTTSWTLDIRMIGPDNVEHGSQLIGTFAADAPSGSEALQLCSLFEPLGTYTILSSVRYRVGSGGAEVVGAQQSEGTFNVVREAKTRTNLKAKRQGAKIVARAKVTISTGGDFSPVAAGGKVLFQKKVGRKWKTVAKDRTSATGRVKATFKSKGRTSVRALFKGMGEVLVGGGLPVPPSKSKVKTVR